jgi:hypothetical protein
MKKRGFQFLDEVVCLSTGCYTYDNHVKWHFIFQLNKNGMLGSTTNNASDHLRVQKERRMSAIIVTVIITYFICFTLYCNLLYCFLIADQCSFTDEFAWMAVLLFRLNCCANPITYALMNRWFRKAFKDMLCIKNWRSVADNIEQKFEERYIVCNCFYLQLPLYEAPNKRYSVQ